MLIVLFSVSHFNFLFVPCGGLSWLPVSFLLHVKYTLSYRIIDTIILFTTVITRHTARSEVWKGILVAIFTARCDAYERYGLSAILPPKLLYY